ncbi:MAG: DUF2249 domain-containing protein [Acidimicrobiales bacterium]|nr:DUF2249 domain-containing protein [Acidimicrobiales bacterium]
MQNQEAFQMMLDHHEALLEGAASRVLILNSSAESGDGFASAMAGVVSYFATEIIPHAIAEEATIYRVGHEIESLSLTIDDLVKEHKQIIGFVNELAVVSDPKEAASISSTLLSVFQNHVAVENGDILSSLVNNADISLGSLLEEMHGALASLNASDSPNNENSSLTESLCDLIIEATKELQKAGSPDKACTIAASAWSTINKQDPKLANRLNTHLHRLVAAINRQQVELGATKRKFDASNDIELDVRPLVPAKRHSLIFETFHNLETGSAFILINDHDPKPLKYQFEAEHSGEFTWDDIELGPKVWKVRISRI